MKNRYFDQHNVRLGIHEYCLMLPTLSEVELEELAESIKANGLKDPIVTYRGWVIGGKNRLLACRIAEVEPVFSEFEPPAEWLKLDEDKIIAKFVLLDDIQRRHLDSGQRAQLACDLAEKTGITMKAAIKAAGTNRKAVAKARQATKKASRQATDRAKQKLRQGGAKIFKSNGEKAPKTPAADMEAMTGQDRARHHASVLYVDLERLRRNYDAFCDAAQATGQLGAKSAHDFRVVLQQLHTLVGKVAGK